MSISTLPDRLTLIKHNLIRLETNALRGQTAEAVAFASAMRKELDELIDHLTATQETPNG